MEKTTSQVLQEARALIEQGWCRDQMRRIDTRTHRYRYCTVGAVHQAVEGDPVRYARVCALLARLLGFSETSPGYIGFWNDARTTTRKDVLALFDRALAEVTK